jgi:hypothetical protein
VEGSGMKAKPHHSRSAPSHRTRTKAGSLEGRNAYPTFHAKESIFQFAK